MPTQKKIQAVEELHQSLGSAECMVVTHYHGLTVKDVTKLRSEMRQKGVKFKVIKNNLAKLAVQGTKFAAAEQFLEGPTAIAYADEPVKLAKGIVEFAKENEKLVVLGGVYLEKTLSKAEVTQLSKLPSLDDLRAKIIGLLNAPAGKIVGVLQAPAGQLARVVKAYSEKQSENN